MIYQEKINKQNTAVPISY